LKGGSGCTGLGHQRQANHLDRADGILDQRIGQRRHLRLEHGELLLQAISPPAGARGIGPLAKAYEALRVLGETIGRPGLQCRPRRARRRVFAQVRPGQFNVELVQALVVRKDAEPADGAFAAGAKAALARPGDRPRSPDRIEVEALHAKRELFFDIAVEFTRHRGTTPEERPRRATGLFGIDSRVPPDQRRQNQHQGGQHGGDDGESG